MELLTLPNIPQVDVPQVRVAAPAPGEARQPQPDTQPFASLMAAVHQAEQVLQELLRAASGARDESRGILDRVTRVQAEKLVLERDLRETRAQLDRIPWWLRWLCGVR